MHPGTYALTNAIIGAQQGLHSEFGSSQHECPTDTRNIKEERSYRATVKGELTLSNILGLLGDPISQNRNDRGGVSDLLDIPQSRFLL